MINKFSEYGFLILKVIVAAILLTGCSSSKNDDMDEEYSGKEIKEEGSEKDTRSEFETGGSVIIKMALFEQNNEMYRVEVDSTYLYWLDNELLILNGSTKCNIYALNVLEKAGYNTPEGNALTRDLFDTLNFTDILPVIGINDVSNALPGDLIIWNGHVIIFESETEVSGEKYAKAFWAGTRNPDNGVNIKNNVCYGKYKLNGNYIVRRPTKVSYRK
ncbi:MAG TPA: hypothetical protein PK536_01665 [Ignavibacteria bacterium]|nr:hypothetical protein [Bacteroidota bacterium]HRI84132.1 hypothetical protein [Ignavibacteria bacterium]HRJ98113.1 hypothetical protein [Ignavibacteria bacterium]